MMLTEFARGLVCLSAFGMALGVTAPCAPVEPTRTQSVSAPIPLWPGEAPGEKGGFGEEKDTTAPGPDGKPKDGIIRLGNVTKPTITIYRPEKSKDTGATVVVCPGGGYNILAMNLEGTEICEWLNSVGVTGVLLKYRVPRRPGLAPHAAPLQDAQRAISMVRGRAQELGIDPNRIGVLGFSAGGHLAAVTSTSSDTRSYTAIDDMDKASCRPDFTVLIYPAYLTAPNDLTKLAPELKVDSTTPPAFLVMTQDDPVKVESVFVYSLALKNAKVPNELHVYATGGHGYGLRPTRNEVTRWPERLASWMSGIGLLKTGAKSK